jgi:hypothetical protein
MGTLTSVKPEPAQAWTASRLRSRAMWLWVAIWLIYLLPALRSALYRPQDWQRVAGTAALVAFAAVYLTSFVYVRAARRQGRTPAAFPWLSLGALAACATALIAVTGQESFGALIYLAVMAVFVLPTRVAWPVVAVLAAATAVLPRLSAGRELQPPSAERGPHGVRETRAFDVAGTQFVLVLEPFDHDPALRVAAIYLH